MREEEIVSSYGRFNISFLSVASNGKIQLPRLNLPLEYGARSGSCAFGRKAMRSPSPYLPRHPFSSSTPFLPLPSTPIAPLTSTFPSTSHTVPLQSRTYPPQMFSDTLPSLHFLAFLTTGPPHFVSRSCLLFTFASSSAQVYPQSLFSVFSAFLLSSLLQVGPILVARSIHFCYCLLVGLTSYYSSCYSSFCH